MNLDRWPCQLPTGRDNLPRWLAEVGRLSLLAPDGIERRRHARITGHPRGLEFEEQVVSLSDRATREILLPPAEYDVVLEEVRYEQGVEVGRRVVGGPVRVTVRARELTECKLN